MTSEAREIMHDVHAHPVHSTRTYWVIAGILTVLTGLEISLYYFEDTLGRGMAATLILILSAAKFILVAMFYMHLKYDSSIFTGIFSFPLALGALVIVSMFLLFHFLHGTSTIIHGTATSEPAIHGTTTEPMPRGH